MDEHFSNVGVITRIEAFLNSLQHRPAVALPTDFNIEQVDIHPCRLAQTPSPNVPLYLPAMGAYTPYLAAYFKQQGADPYELPHLTDDILSLGRAETSAKEYLPFPALAGQYPCRAKKRPDTCAVPDSADAGSGGRRSVRPCHPCCVGPQKRAECSTGQPDAGNTARNGAEP